VPRTYVLRGKIRFADLFDGRLAPFGVQEEVVDGQTSQSLRILTDGDNRLWVYRDGAGFVDILERRWSYMPHRILEAIMKAFETDIVSDSEMDFWGLASEEEWAEGWRGIDEKDKDEGYRQLIPLLQGDANHLEPGSTGFIKAEIARRLIAARPELLLPDKRTSCCGRSSTSTPGLPG
jgi:hypothetical protein